MHVVRPSVRLSVNFSHFHFLPKNHWDNFNKSWHKKSFCGGDSSIYWNEGSCPFPWGDNKKIAKTHWQHLKNLWASLTKLGIKNSCLKGTQVLQIKFHLILKKKIMILFSWKTIWYNHSFEQMCLLIGIVSQMSDVTHGGIDPCVCGIQEVNPFDRLTWRAQWSWNPLSAEIFHKNWNITSHAKVPHEIQINQWNQLNYSCLKQHSIPVRRKGQFHLYGNLDETTKTEVSWHSRRDTIKIPPCS